MDHCDVTRFEKSKRRRFGIQPQLSPPAENDNPRIVFEQLLNVGRLNAGSVVRARFGPVPLTPATRPELCVDTLADVVDVEMTPTVGSHSGRSFVAVHDLSVLTVITDDRAISLRVHGA